MNKKFDYYEIDHHKLKRTGTKTEKIERQRITANTVINIKFALVNTTL